MIGQDISIQLLLYRSKYIIIAQIFEERKSSSRRDRKTLSRTYPKKYYRYINRYVYIFIINHTHNMENLEFDITIAAPVQKVWHYMFHLD